MLFKYQDALDAEVLADLGARVKSHRLNQNITARDLAEKSGVSLRTVSGFERGEVNLSLMNLMGLLRALGLMDNLENLIPKLPEISPLQMMALSRKQKKRVRK